MRSIIKGLLAAGIGTLLAVPALGQTTGTTTAGQTTSNAQLGANNPGVTAAQNLNTALYSRLYGGLNSAVMPTQGGSLQPGGSNVGSGTPPAPGVAVPGSATTGIYNAQQANNAAINRVGVNSALSTAPVQTGTGPATAVPGTAYSQPMPNTYGQATVNTPRGTVNNFPGTTSTGINVPRGTYLPGAGVPGTGMSTPGSIVQSAGQGTIRNAQIATPQFNRVFGGLSTTQFPQSNITTQSGFRTITPQPTSAANPAGTLTSPGAAAGRPGGR